MKHNFSIIWVAIAICAAIATLSSCQCDKEKDKSVNLYGGASRASSYEEYGDFYRSIFSVDEPVKAADLAGSAFPPLVLDENFIALASASGAVVKTRFKDAQWIAELDKGDAPAAGMCADPAGNIYVLGTSGDLYSFDKSGERRWKKRFCDTTGKIEVFSDLLATKEGIYAACSSGKLSKFDFNGKKLWTYASELEFTRRFAVDRHENVVFVETCGEYGKTDKLTILNSRGEYVNSMVFEGARLLKTPVVCGDRIYVAGFYGGSSDRAAVFSIVKKGDSLNLAWTKELSVTPRFLSVAEDGTIYVAGYNAGLGEALSGVFAFSPSGDLIWKTFLKYAIPSPILIGEHSLAVFGKSREKTGLHFFNREDGKHRKTLSMSDAPPVCAAASVMPNGVIVFAASGKIALVRVDESAIDKILPF